MNLYALTVDDLRALALEGNLLAIELYTRYFGRLV